MEPVRNPTAEGDRVKLWGLVMSFSDENPEMFTLDCIINRYFSNSPYKQEGVQISRGPITNSYLKSELITDSSWIVKESKRALTDTYGLCG